MVDEEYKINNKKLEIYNYNKLGVSVIKEYTNDKLTSIIINDKEFEVKEVIPGYYKININGVSIYFDTVEIENGVYLTFLKDGMIIAIIDFDDIKEE